MTLGRISQAFPLDFICLGGDAANPRTYDKNAATHEELIASIDISSEDILKQRTNVQKALDDALCPIIPLIGNHEAQDNHPDMTGEMFFDTNFKQIAESGYIQYEDTST